MTTLAIISVLLPCALAAVAGLLFGSFLNVCISRLPRGLSILTPRSHCPSCQQPIRACDNVPILSFLFLRGRCRHCRQRISFQYPLVEAALAALFVACVLHTGLAWQTALDAVLIFLLLGLAVMDAQTFLLPDAFTLSGLVIAFAMKILLAAQQHRAHVAFLTARDAALAALLLLLIRWLYFLARKQEGMGLGDVKLLAMMAAFLGLPLALLACFLAVVAGAAASLALLLQRRAHAQQMIPFGSFLAAAGIAVIFLGRPLLEWYLHFFH